MRAIKKTGDPIKEAIARPQDAPSNRSASMDLYGFEDGPVKMTPHMLLEALLLGRGMAKAGSAAAKNILKKGQGKRERVLRALSKEFGSNQLESEALSIIQGKEGIASEVFGLQ